jgi:N-acetylglucosaminyl-diphospho-decaprenol L-rhamnosyltransferase
MPPVPPDLTISVISADNLELLLPCLRSVFKNTHTVALEVYVVDNASADGTADAVEAEFPQVRVIQNKTRLGFSTNNNLVLRQGCGRYLMLLNDDTLVLDGAFDGMIKFMDAQPEAGAVGSSYLNADFTYQQSFSPFPNPWYEGLWSAVDLLYRFRKRPPDKPIQVDCVSGACMMVRASAAGEVGFLDTDFDPIYCEETDWLYRIRKAGWLVYTLPDAKVVHYGGQTMKRIPLRRAELLQSHKALFFRKHYGRWATWFFKGCLILSGLAKAFLWSMRIPLDKTAAANKVREHLHVASRALRF